MASSDDVGGMTVEAGDVAGLAAYQYVGFLSSSLQAIMRDRDLALVALEACESREGFRPAASRTPGRGHRGFATRSS